MSVEGFREKLAFFVMGIAFAVAPQPLRNIMQLSMKSGLGVVKGAYEQVAKQAEMKKEVKTDNVILH